MVRVRVLSGVLALLAMMGLPVASVACLLACQAPSTTRHHEPTTERAARDDDADCHDASSEPATGDEMPPAVAQADRLVVVGGHHCDGPESLSPASLPDVLRLAALADLPATSESWYVSSRDSHAGAVAVTGRGPAPPRTGSFQIALRI